MLNLALHSCTFNVVGGNQTNIYNIQIVVPNEPLLGVLIALLVLMHYKLHFR